MSKTNPMAFFSGSVHLRPAQYSFIAIYICNLCLDVDNLFVYLLQWCNVKIKINKI
jgi:hypothetical protein